jgi:hypothetical protein
MSNKYPFPTYVRYKHREDDIWYWTPYEKFVSDDSESNFHQLTDEEYIEMCETFKAYANTLISDDGRFAIFVGIPPEEWG